MKNNMTTTIIIILIGNLILMSWLLYKQINKPLPLISNITQINNIVIDKVTYDLAVMHIKENEGLQLQPYADGDYQYIGYGHQIGKNESYLLNGITTHYADMLLKIDLNKRILVANNIYGVIGNKALAIAMLMYNIGNIKGELHSILLKNIDTKNELEYLELLWISHCKYKGKEHDKIKERRMFEFKIYKN